MKDNEIRKVTGPTSWRKTVRATQLLNESIDLALTDDEGIAAVVEMLGLAKEMSEHLRQCSYRGSD